ncbi:MAG: aldose 1-epimerase family protein [Acetatifactor sp.]|nr:aldose 1-epimerase family protein [Acetatifactor sp.]
MAVYELKNDVLSVLIDSVGAELKSLKRLSDGREYLWCGDAAYWGRTSPVLFPFVGGVRNREYRAKGRTWSMTQHGFARDMEFGLLSQGENEIWFELDSDENTLEKFPYVFGLKAGYRLEKNKVVVMWQVVNPGDETLHFSIGGHPAFNCPLEAGEKQEDCFLDFGDVDQVASTEINVSGLATDSVTVYGLENGKLALNEKLFERDALVIENRQTDMVGLCGRDGNRYVKVTMDAPLFGVWTPAGKKAPFICIEPWYGRCDGENFEGTLEEREWGNHVEAGGVWEASYTIELE